ncbi:hypothetical protein B0H94_108185 [Salsuginibacillus halophilus]|uniref:Uncharacterized protein n=1 Tax=Salsuginibacillus halophilus TaxID=517424 RepID=A0A2P8HEC5_9BACI|nr:hypothetical protein [Salsuginibacillus halophilus]PSL44572.1 hypothetical protein B0H94_108185 [Salsuginibacillus halophilus]
MAHTPKRKNEETEGVNETKELLNEAYGLSNPKAEKISKKKKNR